MRIYEFIGLIAGLLIILALLPALIKIIKNKELSKLKTSSLLLFTAGFCLWIVYGIGLSAAVLVLASSIGFVCAGGLLALKIRKAKKIKATS